MVKCVVPYMRMPCINCSTLLMISPFFLLIGLQQKRRTNTFIAYIRSKDSESKRTLRRLQLTNNFFSLQTTQGRVIDLGRKTLRKSTGQERLWVCQVENVQQYTRCFHNSTGEDRSIKAKNFFCLKNAEVSAML